MLEEVPIPVRCNNINVIEIAKRGPEFFISTRFYNLGGELIFWMSMNRYWTKSYFDIHSSDKYLKIFKVDDPNIYIEIRQVNDFLEINGITYMNGKRLFLFPDRIVFGSTKFSTNTMKNVHTGYSFSG